MITFKVQKIIKKKQKKCPGCNWTNTRFIDIQHNILCPECFFDFLKPGTKIEIIKNTQSSSPSPQTKEEKLIAFARKKAKAIISGSEPCGTLSKIADEHNRIVTESDMIRNHITPFSSVYRLNRGQNNKRILYGILNKKGEVVFAYGTFFGRESSFNIEGGGRDLKYNIIFLLTNQEKMEVSWN